MEEDSTDSDGSSQNLGLSPQSTTTNATSVGTIHDSNGCHKRKRKAVDVLLPRKRPRMDPFFDGKALPIDAVLGSTTTGVPCMPRKDQGDELSERLALSDAEECRSLPTSVWKSIFMYLPPRSLGTLLSVNSVFHRLLTGSSPKPGGGPISQDTIHKDAERIWTMARQRHHPHLPRPLHGYRELDMWRLIGASQCQFCVQSLGSPLQSSDYPVGNHLTYQEPTRAQIYWPLAVRSCQRCLGRQFSTEIELRSSNLSYLIQCMNYAFVKDSPSSMDSRSVPTPGSKIYLRSHMEWLHAETLRITHSSNSAKAEVWLKTYEVNAQKRQRDAARWERWEATNGRVKLFPKSRRRMTSGISSPASTCRSSPTPPAENFTRGPLPMNPSVTFEEAQYQKTARLQDLARRALELDPPIPLNVLKHTPAYQVAQHIARPLDNFEWSSLRDRLEAQRPQAEILALAELSDRPSSPQSSDGSTMSKNKKRKNRLSKSQRRQANAGPTALSATGANAVPTCGSNAPIAVQRPAAVAPTPSASLTATMSRAMFNHQSQRAPVTTGQTFGFLGGAVQQPSPWCTAAAAAIEPYITASNAGIFSSTIGPVNMAPATTVSSTSSTGPLCFTARLAPELTQAPITASAKSSPVVRTVNPAASRSDSQQHSIRPEVIKIESDELQPYRPSRPEYRSPHVYRPETEAVRQSETSSRPHFDAARYHDNPRSRSRSRSPGNRRRLVNTYRERHNLALRRNIPAAYQPTNIAHVAPLRGGHNNYYDYPAPVARYVPHVPHDDYGNEYVRTAPREPNPYVLYPPPPARGY